MKQTEMTQFAQNAITALNGLMTADKMSSKPRTIVKIARFKEWLKRTVSEIEAQQTEADLFDDADELNDSTAEQGADAESVNKQPEPIKFN